MTCLCCGWSYMNKEQTISARGQTFCSFRCIIKYFLTVKKDKLTFGERPWWRSTHEY